MVESYSYRIKFGAIFSNFVSSTNIRLNAIVPQNEFKTLPQLKNRLKDLTNPQTILKKGEILVPELLAKGMKVKAGDTIVLVANNKSGSVNGINLKVAGIVEQISGPGGRDGYIHIDDAKKVLRIKAMEVSEVVIRLKDVSLVPKMQKELKPLTQFLNQKGKPSFEVTSLDKIKPIL